MSSPRLGRVLQKIPFSDGESLNKDTTFKADVRTDSGDVVAVIKHLPNTREVAVEYACAALGIEIGLPVPEPLIVIDDDDKLYFGLIYVEAPSFQRIARSCHAVSSQLLNWDKLHFATMFDTWIANSDRNGKNLLLNGAGDFWLIDHGMAIPSNLSAENAVRNLLLLFINDNAKDQLSIKRHQKKIDQHIAKDYSDDIDIFIANNKWIVEDVLKFIQDRINYMPQLLGGKVGNNGLFNQP